MTDTPKADALTEALRQTEGNPLAGLLLSRLAYAEDPEAEADKVTEEVVNFMRAAVEAFAPLARLYTDTMGPN